MPRIQQLPRASLVVLAAVLLAGCGLGEKNILFVTKTTVGVDVDSKPPTFDVGYDRKEGTLSPIFEDGTVLPQMAGFSSDLGIVNQAIGQSFATGNAAVLMSKYLTSDAQPGLNDPIPDSEIKEFASVDTTGKRKRYFFATDTSFGLRVNFGLETGGIPDSLSLGYKRKELAFVPLMEGPSGNPLKPILIKLPSLLATTGVGTDVSTPGSTKVVQTQFFATGAAADNLAALPGIRAAVAPRIMPDSATARKVQIQIKQTRNADFVKKEKQARVDKLLDDVTELADDRAFELNRNPPVKDDEVDNVVALRDPHCLRLSDRDCDGDGSPDPDDGRTAGDPIVAKEVLRTRIVMGSKRSDTDLGAWEAAIMAGQ